MNAGMFGSRRTGYFFRFLSSAQLSHTSFAIRSCASPKEKDRGKPAVPPPGFSAARSLAGRRGARRKPEPMETEAA